jgi:hypothetical protein
MFKKIQIPIIVLTFMISSICFANEDSKKSYEEISKISKTWKVEKKSGTITYNFKIELNGKLTGEIGTFSGVSTIICRGKNLKKCKGKTIKITFSGKLIKGKFLYKTKYPAFTTTLKGTKTSSHPEIFPVKKNVHKYETFLLQTSKLCPKSYKIDKNLGKRTGCMKPKK